MRQHGTARNLVGSAFGNYLPQQLVSATEVGSLFVARAAGQGNACLLRVLSLPSGIPEAELGEHAAQFSRAAAQIQQIQHPYLLPLVDAGFVGDVPYLVWPLIAMRPLATIDGQVAPVDVLTASRYLDEIAAALEYAHERGLIHGNLALEGIYAQRDGRLLVGDLGVRQLIELLRHDMQWHYLYTLTDPSAPEQTLGRRARNATDVYLLACVLFRLLTGQQIFEGATREDVAHAHLHEPVPPLSAFRPDLPRGLDGLMTAALAKEPGSRIQRPGELANAFHEIVAPDDMTRVPFASAGPALAPTGNPSGNPMTRPLTYGPFTPGGGEAAYPYGNYGNGSRATGTPRQTGTPPNSSYGPAPSGAGWGNAANGGHPELPRPSLPQPSPRLTRPPVSSGPVSRGPASRGPAVPSRPLMPDGLGPAAPSRPLISGRPVVPSQPRPPSQPMTFVRPHPTSQPMVPPRTTSAPPISTATGPVPPMRITAAPAGAHGPIEPKRRGSKLLLIPLLIVLIAVGGGLALRNFAGVGTASGQVIFADNPLGPSGVTSSLTISAASLAAPPQGSHYAAWLVNSHTEQVLPLGTLIAAPDGKFYTLSYQGATTGGVNLLGAGDTIEITVETGVASAPAGHVVLIGSFPPKAFVHIGHLLVAYPATPGGVGIMTGALRQTALVNAQAQLLLAASNNGDPTSEGCYAQNVVNIIEGRNGSDYRQLPSACAALQIAPAGDGYGLFTATTQAEPGYLDAVVLHASLAATQADASSALQQHAQLLEVAVGDTRAWLRDALADALSLLASPGNQTLARQLQTLASEAYQGTDTNGDGHVDPVQGEAGIVTAYTEAQLMATITLKPRS